MGGHDLLAVKDNQPTLRAAVEGLFEDAVAAEFVGVDHDPQVSEEVGHGRPEERCVTGLYHPVGRPDDWADVDAVGQVLRERVVNGVRTNAAHDSVSSHAGSAAEMGDAVRGHRGIEAMHWVLDVMYGEDDSRVRAGHAGANLGVVRTVAVSLTRRAPGKVSGKTKRRMAGWDDDFLLQVRQGIPRLATKQSAVALQQPAAVRVEVGGRAVLPEAVPIPPQLGRERRPQRPNLLIRHGVPSR